MGEMKKVLDVLEQQRTVIDNLTMVSKRIAANINDLAARLYLEQLLSMLEGYWTAISALNIKRHNHHAQCKQGQLTEDLINPRFLQNLQSSVEVKLSADWYYNYVPIDSLLEIDGHFVCKVIIPIVRNEPNVNVQIYSLPVPTQDRKYVQVYHSVEVTVKQDGYLLHQQKCLGRNPKVCLAGPCFDRQQSECIDGILLGHPEKQKSCEVTYTKTFDQARLAINTFLAYLTTTMVEERCERGLPETTPITSPINIV